MIAELDGPRRWQVAVTFGDGYEFDAMLLTSGVFECNDEKIYNAVCDKIDDADVTNGIGVLPPLYDLTVTQNNPASIAGALFDAIIETYPNEENLNMAFTGAYVLLPGVTLEDDEDAVGMNDSFDSSWITITPYDVAKTFIAKYDESEERDEHGRWTKGDANDSGSNEKQPTGKAYGQELHTGVVFNHQTHGRVQVMSVEKDKQNPDTYVRVRLKKLDGNGDKPITVAMTKKKLVEVETNTFDKTKSPLLQEAKGDTARVPLGVTLQPGEKITDTTFLNIGARLANAAADNQNAMPGGVYKNEDNAKHPNADADGNIFPGLSNQEMPTGVLQNGVDGIIAQFADEPTFRQALSNGNVISPNNDSVAVMAAIFGHEGLNVSQMVNVSDDQTTIRVGVNNFLGTSLMAGLGLKRDDGSALKAGDYLDFKLVRGNLQGADTKFFARNIPTTDTKWDAPVAKTGCGALPASASNIQTENKETLAAVKELYSTKAGTAQIDSSKPLDSVRTNVTLTDGRVVQFERTATGIVARQVFSAEFPAKAAVQVSGSEFINAQAALAEEFKKMDLAARAQEFKSTWPMSFWNSIPKNEKDAVQTFTGGSYVSINKSLGKFLRHGESLDSAYVKKIALIDRGLAQRPTTSTVFTMRHVGANTEFMSPDGIQLTPEMLTPGATFLDKGFASTSVSGEWGPDDHSIMEDFPKTSTRTEVTSPTLKMSEYMSKIQLSVTVPPGVPSGYVAKFSHHPSENEFLLGRNLQYVITKVEEVRKFPTATPLLVVHATVVPPTDLTPPPPEVQK